MGNLLGDFRYAPNRGGAEWLAAEVIDRCQRLGMVRAVGPGLVPAHAKVTATGFVPNDGPLRILQRIKLN